MAIAEQVKGDMVSAMKAGESVRVGTLRLLLSELQKSAKESKAPAAEQEELAVLRRERKRRLEAERAYTEAGRSDLAAGERAEAELIATYLPAELSAEELQKIVTQAVAESGAAGPKDIGRAMPLAIKAVDGRADGRRVSELVREALAGG